MNEKTTYIVAGSVVAVAVITAIGLSMWNAGTQPELPAPAPAEALPQFNAALIPQGVRATTFTYHPGGLAGSRGRGPRRRVGRGV